MSSRALDVFKAEYVAGAIEVDEFERKVGIALSAENYAPLQTDQSQWLNSMIDLDIERMRIGSTKPNTG
jgi:hypothetical protein